MNRSILSSCRGARGLCPLDVFFGLEAAWQGGNITRMAESLDKAPPGRARETGPALEFHYRFLLWLAPAVEHFPRRRKFLLGDRIQDTALDVLERLIEATYIRRRDEHLARANLGIEKLSFLVNSTMLHESAESGIFRHQVNCCLCEKKTVASAVRKPTRTEGNRA